MHLKFLTAPLTLTLAIGCTPAVWAANIVSNGGFEDGTVNNTAVDWVADSGTLGADPFVRANGFSSASITVAEGNNALQFRGNDVAGGDGSVEQALTTVASTEYILDFSLTAFGPNSADLAVRVTVTSDGGTLGDLFDQMYAGGADFDVFGTSGWSSISETFTATGTTSTLRFQEASSNSNLKDPYLDAVSVDVPEPGSLALLGLGGLLIARRRRG